MSAGSGPRILIAAGGTGGHLFPALALAEELNRRGCIIDIVTDARAQSYGTQSQAIRRHRVSAGGIAGKTIGRRVVGLARLAVGFLQALILILRLRPHCAIGFGGYASVPAILAAQWRGLPTMIHEQNAVMGRANRLLARRARTVALGFQEAANPNLDAAGKFLVTGNPVRPAICALASKSYQPPMDDQPINLFIMGGSQGAGIFAHLVPSAIEALPVALRARLCVAQQCRAEDLADVDAAYRRMNVAAELKAFFDDVPARLDTAHLVIARAGAASVSELAAAGRPAILIPLKNSIDDHQGANARAFASAGAGWVIDETRHPEELAAKVLQLVNDPATLKEAASMARRFGKPNAATELADAVMALLPLASARSLMELMV